MDIIINWVLIGLIICGLVAFIYWLLKRSPKKRQFPGKFLGGAI